MFNAEHVKREVKVLVHSVVEDSIEETIESEIQEVIGVIIREVIIGSVDDSSAVPVADDNRKRMSLFARRRLKMSDSVDFDEEDESDSNGTPEQPGPEEYGNHSGSGTATDQPVDLQTGYVPPQHILEALSHLDVIHALSSSSRQLSPDLTNPAAQALATAVGPWDESNGKLDGWGTGATEQAAVPEEAAAEEYAPRAEDYAAMTFHDQVQARIKERTRKLLEKTQQLADDTDTELTHRPVINARSAQIAKNLSRRSREERRMAPLLSVAAPRRKPEFESVPRNTVSAAV